jgi:hypothetical protein
MISTQDPPVPKGKLYFFSYYTSQIRYFASEASTAEQLKSSGNLRIMKTEVALKLSEYERRIKSLENDYSLFRIEYETMIALRLKIFDGLTSVQLFGSDSVRSRNPAHRDSVYLLNPPLSNPDAMLMREFIGWVKQESSFWKTNIREFIIPIQKTCGELLQLLRTNYHLK